MNTTTCFAPAHILLPAERIPLEQWGCIACDQFTSDREYWQRAKEAADGSPSTLNLILPEVYLEDGDADARVEQIHATMADYAQNVLTRAVDGFVYVERTEQSGRVRQGLVGRVDLEAYSYRRGEKCTVRPSECTVESRIPPRMKVRTGASLETPHIMMLADDPGCTLVEPIGAHKSELKKVYEGELMQGGGHIKGYFIKDDARIDRALRALEALASPEVFSAKYGTDAPSLLFAMGDGNHSFATAKANWEQIKKTLSPEEAANHPARYALVELENVHDSGIEFEPIHRVVFGVDTHKAIAWLSEKLSEQNGETEMHLYGSKAERDDAMAANACSKCHLLPFMIKEGYGYFKVSDPAAQLEVGTLQNALDIFIKETDGATIDYIHGEQVVDELGRKDNNIGFILPNMGKSAFFKTVIFDGALPRKTFSMGEANESGTILSAARYPNNFPENKIRGGGGSMLRAPVGLYLATA